MAGSMVYRLRVTDPSAAHMATFIKAVTAIQARLDNKSFNYVSGLHGAPGWYCWHHQISPLTPVQARLFLPWHRAYLQRLELLLQDQLAGAALPWWDWTQDRAIPRAYSVTQVDGKANPLRRYRMQVPKTTRNPAISHFTVRHPGANPQSRLPTKSEIDAVLLDSDWASFSDRLESYHDDVHVWVGGDMLDITTAAFDPIFYAHHCMIDRIWYLWQVKNGNGGIPQSLLKVALEPFGKTFRDVLDVTALGYEYGGAATPISVGGGPQ
jgi:tyrosinase